jgi:hypothetical protein
MKPWYWILIALILSAVPQAYASEYSQMKKEADAYRPPDIFSIATVLSPAQTAAGTSNDPVRVSSGPAVALNAIPRPDLAKEIAAIGKDSIDPATYARIKTISADETALTQFLGKEVVLEQLKAMALLRNPDINAARKKVLAEGQAFSQVMNLDDLLRQYSAFTQSITPDVGPINAKGSVKMAFPSPGVTALKGNIVEKSVLRQIETAAVTGKTVLKDVETVFWNLVYLDRSIQITRDTISALNRLKGVATILYKSGKTSFQDVIKINIKVEELKEALVTLASRKQTQTVRMFELVNLPRVPTGPVRLVHLPRKLKDITSLYALARTNRQELAALRFQIEKVTEMLELAKTMTHAPQTLGFSFSDADFATTTGTDAPKTAFSVKTMAAMKNNSPVRAWNGINEPWLQQTRQTLESLKNTLKARENATDSLVRQAWFKADKALRELGLYKGKILSLSQSAVEVANREYEAGIIPFSQAIGSYTDWLNVRLTIAQKNADLGTAFAELEAIIGKSLR